MSNNVPEYFDIEITSEYGYNLEDIVETLTNNIFHLRANFESANFLSSELELIGEEFVSTARRFAEAQGLGQGGGRGTSLLHGGRAISLVSYGPKNVKTSSSGLTGNSGNLINHIKYQIVGGNKDVVFYNDAQNSRGQYYAGHIEYGFHDRGGNLVPARPFMRPALYAVADSSRGRIQRTMKAYLEQMWAMEPLQFGNAITPKGHYRRFFELHENPFAKGYGKYTASGLPKGRIAELASKEGRMKSTIDRRGQVNIEKTQSLSGRMGSKGGWYKGYSGRVEYKDGKWTRQYSDSTTSKKDTRWIKSSESNSLKMTQTPDTMKDSSTKGFNGKTTSNNFEKARAGKQKANQNVMASILGRR